MHFDLSEDQRLFQSSLRTLLEKECRPDHVRAAWQSDDGRVPGLWRKLAELGVVGLTAPEEYGGSGLGELDWVLLFEEAGRAALPEPLLATTAVGIPLVAELGNDALRDAWLSRAAAGDAVLAVGLRDAAHVEDAHIADLVLLETTGVVHAVPRGRSELEPQRSVDRSRRLFALHWETVDTLVAHEDEARPALARAFDRGALASAALLVGLAAQMLDTAVEYAKVRRQFGKPIGSFQAVQHKLTDVALKVDFARPAVYRAAYALAHEEPDAAVHVSLAKAFASDAALFAAKQALQVHGAIGYTTECDLHFWMKRAWCVAAEYGDASWHRARIASHIL